MPVGTLATVKGISTEQLAKTGAQMVLSNTYHLHLQPGEAIVSEAGGLHRFMGWNGPMLTDSGGFQVFSLGDLNRIDDRGVVFRNPRDGRTIDMTPEHATAIQMALGADVAMAFDQCPPFPATENDVIDACRRTHAWLERCVNAHTRTDQALFGIVQGGCFPHLRRESARAVASFDLPGIAVGGVSVGEPVDEMHRIVRDVTPLLPLHRPRYLMGIGTLKEMAIAVANGIDLFDCVLPTRLGRHGTALVEASAGTCAMPASGTTTRHWTQLLLWPAQATPAPICTTDPQRGIAWAHPAEHSQHHPSGALYISHGAGHRRRMFFENFTPWEADSPAHHTW